MRSTPNKAIEHLRETVQKPRLAVYGEQSGDGQTWPWQTTSVFCQSGYDATREDPVNGRTTFGRSQRQGADPARISCQTRSPDTHCRGAVLRQDRAPRIISRL